MPKIGVEIHRNTRRIFNTRRILLKRFPYAVIYLPLHNKIVVIAVMHQRRRPDYWKTRISSQ